jgi:tRNA(adenine34) deaminase
VDDAIKGDDYWMAKAIEQARKAQEVDEVPVGAIVVKNEEIIGKGFNQVITQNDASGHAEIIAIRDAGKHLKNYRLVQTKLYVTLEPCMMCVGAMVHARIDKVIFGAYDHKTGMAGTKDNCFDKFYHNHKIKVVGGVLEMDCARLLKNFFKMKRAKKQVD